LQSKKDSWHHQKPYSKKHHQYNTRGNKPLAINIEEFFNILTYYHLYEFSSGREVIQALKEDDHARQLIAPADGLSVNFF
jgi:hypothetical protein